MKELEDLLGKQNVKYNEPMSKHTTFKVGGNADIFITVDSIEKLQKVLQILDYKNITVVGNGSNLLVKDSGIRGTVVKYIAKEYNIKDNEVVVDAGITNARLASVLLKQNLTGFEFAAGIPGTIGGALVMNAGAYGKEMKDIVQKTTYIDLEDKKTKTINLEEHEFSYRHSAFQNKKCIIVQTTLKFEKGNSLQIQNTMNEYAEKRRTSQPLEMPSAGSTFKRGDGFITAKLIDEAGLKGYSIGGAEVSTKHAGFIVNKGNATAKDIIELIDVVKKKVYEKFQKNIETEVKIIGD